MLQRVQQWPPNYGAHLKWRQELVLEMRKDPKAIVAAHKYYKTRPVEWIETWCDTSDPRNASLGRMTRFPFLLFDKQREFVHFLHELLINEQNGLCEKARDVGATWLCCAFSIWAFIYHDGISIGWGSLKGASVDNSENPDSIFWKLRFILGRLPEELAPKWVATHMKIVNHTNGSSITGECGDNIGRGGRKLIYFKDESAHYERPELIEAALADNTRIQVDISSVNGLGNVFYRRRMSGALWMPGQPMELGKTQVFVFDWRDHPAKDQAWYEQRKAKAIEEGLLHVFAQEVDRNYSAAIEGTIIPAEWVRSAIDAHLKLDWFDDSGGWSAALDVADGGGDRNALSKRKGVILRYAEEWGERDVGATTRRAVAQCDGMTIDINYDNIGVGAGVKAEANRLEEEGLLPAGIRFIGWDAGSPPQDPDERVVPGDDETPLNKDFYANRKAQAWWLLRLRFERTHRAVTEGIRYPVDQMISIDSRIPRLRQIERELSQPTLGKSARMKIMVNKTPPGTKSPNIGDSIVMNYHPVVEAEDSSYDGSLSWL